MYGLLVDSIQTFIKLDHGDEVWDKILQQIGMPNTIFHAYKIYDDNIIGRIAETCVAVIDEKSSIDEFKRYFGQCFVKHFSLFGYGKLIRASGRHFRDFVHGIDDLHNQIRFGFPKMSSPFFHVEKEDQDGLVVEYRSKRQGYGFYVIGQFQCIAETVYNLNIDVSIIGEPTKNADTDLNLVRLRLNFDNSPYVQATMRRKDYDFVADLPKVSVGLVFKIIPFAVAFDANMNIKMAGGNFKDMFGGNDVIGMKVTSILKLERPKVNFEYEQGIADGMVVPNKFLEPPAPQAVMELVKCGCKGRCMGKSNYSCLKNNLSCTDFCKCEDCANIKYYTPEGETDDDSGEGETEETSAW